MGLRHATAVALLLAASAARAGGIYTYTQPDGTIVYTNVAPPGSVHAKHVKGTFTAAPKASEPPAPKPAQALAFDEAIQASAERYKIPVALVRAIMHAESNFNTHALSAKGASGLMQLMPTTAHEMYVKDIFDAKANIDGGVRYLRVLANQYNGDMVKMVAAYNAGPEAIRKAGGNIPQYAETQDYVRKVIALYYQYKQGSQPVAATP